MRTWQRCLTALVLLGASSSCGTISTDERNSPPAVAQWLNHPTPGMPRTADGKPNLSAPAPRMAASLTSPACGGWMPVRRSSTSPAN